jgi:hypothetical protein
MVPHNDDEERLKGKLNYTENAHSAVPWKRYIKLLINEIKYVAICNYEKLFTGKQVKKYKTAAKFSL